MFSGNCGSLTSIDCVLRNAVNHRVKTFTNFVIGQSYFVRLYGGDSKGSISVINPPANDEITGAVALAPSPANLKPLQSYYTHAASKKMGWLCSANSPTLSYDVWFYFIAEAANHTVSITADNNLWDEQAVGYNIEIEAFRGFAADSASLRAKIIACGTNSLSLTSLVAGDTVYLRAANRWVADNSSIFSIKVSNAQSIDEPGGALLLNTINSYQDSISTQGATASLPGNSCGSAIEFADDDVWLKFYAGANAKRIVAGKETNDIKLQLFSGTPGNLTALQCSNNIMLLPATLTSGAL